MSTVDPVPRVEKWLADAREVDPGGFDAMCLSTVGEDGRPSSRMVLLKSFDRRGFVFYTNGHSRKGRELTQHPLAALCFHWPALGRQLRAEGAVSVVTEEEADAYFASRARGSQIGAWASHQGETLSSREELLSRFAETERRYEGTVVPRPPHWGGFRVTPDMIELWQSEPSRLHDREAYLRSKDGWSRQLLNP